MPESILFELQKLQDTVAPMHFDHVLQIIESELEGPVDEVFEWLDPAVLGSASIGQVHRGILRSGEVVAVKVQRPEAQNRVEADLQIMREFAAFLDRRFGQRIFVDVQELVAEFEGVIRRELDYATEAGNSRRFAVNFADTPVVIPGVYLEFSTSPDVDPGIHRGDPFSRHTAAAAGSKRAAAGGNDGGQMRSSRWPSRMVFFTETRIRGT